MLIMAYALLTLLLTCRGFEDMTLLKLRQAAERAAAIQQVQAEDNERP